MRKTAFTCFAVAGAGLFIFLFVARAQQPGGPTGKAGPKGGVEGRLTWFDRQGNLLGTAGEAGLYRTLAISPDGRRIAFERADPQTQNRDIWIHEIDGGKTTRFTSDPGWEAFPTWSPDGKRIIFTSNRSGVYELYQKASNGEGPEELFYQSSEGKGPTSWSPDGRFLIYYSLGQPTHLRLLAVAGPADRKPAPLVDPQFTSISGRFSPDGRWVAYASNESGMNEISVRSFDPAAGSVGKPVIVTNGGGRSPAWRGDGKEIFYIAQDGTMMGLEWNPRTTNASARFQDGSPKPLFKAPSGVLFWDASPDGRRFLMPVPERENRAHP